MKLIITGPRSVGKTTISKIVAKKSELKYISSDEIGEEAMKEKEWLDKAIKSGEIGKWIKKDAYNLIRKVYEKDNFVFDLSGGSISSRKFSKASKKFRKTAKEKSDKIIGLLPSESENKSIEILFNREKQREHFREMDKKELFEKVKKDYLKFPKLFNKFCNFIIYTENKTPEEIADEITKRTNSKTL